MRLCCAIAGTAKIIPQMPIVALAENIISLLSVADHADRRAATPDKLYSSVASRRGPNQYQLSSRIKAPLGASLHHRTRFQRPKEPRSFALRYAQLSGAGCIQTAVAFSYQPKLDQP